MKTFFKDFSGLFLKIQETDEILRSHIKEYVSENKSTSVRYELL